MSVSYADDWAVAAVASTAFARALGIDAVAAPVSRTSAMLDRVLPAPADHRTWARVEAVLKADGRGLAVDPADVRIEEATDGFLARAGETVFRGWDASAPDGVLLSVAARTRRDQRDAGSSA